MSFIFFGSSEFSKIVLEKLLQVKMKPFLIVTNPPRPKGRKQILSPTPVYLLAQENNIELMCPEKLDEEFINKIKTLRPEFCFLTAYGKILPSELLVIPRKGFINLHPSLLPLWRGATPIQSVILNGDKETGVSLILMDEQVDHGPVIAQSKINIENSNLNYQALSNLLANLGAELIIKIIPQYLEGKITLIQQNHAQATFCKKILPEDEKIDWNKTSIQIDRKVRALNPEPSVYTKAFHSQGNELTIKVLKGFAQEEETLEKEPIGKVFNYKDKLAVRCQKGFYVIELLKPSGKQAMLSGDFMRGNNWILNQILK